VSDETRVSPDIVDHHHNKVDDVEKAHELNLLIACKVTWNCEYRNRINVVEIDDLLHEIEVDENV